MNFRKEFAANSATMLKLVLQNFQKNLREKFENGHNLTDTIFRK
jgi:hypothetical protein